MALAACLLAGCSGGAVVFAPTPAAIEAAPVAYNHPSGAFALQIPPSWARYEQYTTTLAAAAFSPPDSDHAALTIATVRLAAPIETEAFAALIEQYQTEIRPNADLYREQSREPMGDGSWRLTGAQQTATGATERLNTFIDRDGDLITVAEVVLPDAPAQAAALERALNSLVVSEGNTLAQADLRALTYAQGAALSLTHIAAWTTEAGVFFVTGEVGNYGSEALGQIPVEVSLLNRDGAVIDGAVDMAMGHGIEPGGFAPFSLRFGAGMPPDAVTYRLRLGGDGETAAFSAVAGLHGADALDWTDESARGANGELFVRGAVTNTGSTSLREVRAILTVFDAAGRVIGAGVSEATPALLPAGETGNYEVALSDLGGDPVNYIVEVHGLE